MLELELAIEFTLLVTWPIWLVIYLGATVDYPKPYITLGTMHSHDKTVFVNST